MLESCLKTVIIEYKSNLEKSHLPHGYLNIQSLIGGVKLRNKIYEEYQLRVSIDLCTSKEV